MTGARSPRAGARSRAAASARDAAFLEDPNALDALSLRARFAQVDLLRRQTLPELMLFLVPFAAASVATAARRRSGQSRRLRRGRGGGVRGVRGGGFRDVPSRGILRGVRVVPAGVRDRDVPPERVSDAFRRLGATGARGGDGRRVAVRRSRVVVDFRDFSLDADSRRFRRRRAREDPRSRRGFRGVRRARPAALVPETRRKEVPAFPAGDVDVCVRGDRARVAPRGATGRRRGGRAPRRRVAPLGSGSWIRRRSGRSLACRAWR